MTVAAIRIEELELKYKNRDSAAVRDLSIEIADGEFVALLGPSGCGKTTTLRMIAGFLRPTAGRILVDGRVYSSAESVLPPERRGMGMVFQNYAVWPHMTVFDNIAFGLTARQVKRRDIEARVAAIIQTVNLKGLERSFPGQLSGGQQQRVALARSLVVEPGTLLLDEPLSNLDVKLRERMRWELKELQRRTGVTFVYVTHDQSEAMAIADRVAVMNQGLLQQYGTPREVYSRPANRFVADFMGTVNLVRGTVAGPAPGGACVRLLDEPRVEIAVPGHLPAVAGTEVLLAIRPEDVILSATGEGVPCRIEQATFLGSVNDYRVSVPGSGPASPLELRVQTPAHESFEAGAGARVAIKEERCVLVS
jgi:iron(III) transport system ATP-binding protein